ncbi:DUF2690 domain-containing protein, partial [Streptomyces sp. NPDC058953]|uniref:DUF2690 domain-containing protein n=1 Tax=Streptomyces sp. NPDC058953 TaxID=3346676 RepID=UPI0036CF8BD5
ARRAAEAAAAAAAGNAPAEQADPPSTVPAPAPAAAPAPAPGARPAPGVDKRRILLFLSGVVGALVLVAAAVLFTDLGGTGDGDDTGRDRTETVAKVPPTSSGASTGTGTGTGSGPGTSPGPSAPPAGVKCTGTACNGKTPEAMGCGAGLARTVSQATVGKARIEVRFSQVCQAAWARLVDASTGDSVRISVGGKGVQRGTVNGESDAYTPMTAAGKGSDAKACAELTNGTTACTVVQ